MAAYYPDAQVRVTGHSIRFDRATETGGVFENHFCPDCGATVFFRGAKNAGVTGVALGAFVDRHEMAPVRSVWEQSRHPWVTIPTAQQTFAQGRTWLGSPHGRLRIGRPSGLARGADAAHRPT